MKINNFSELGVGDAPQHFRLPPKRGRFMTVEFLFPQQSEIILKMLIQAERGYAKAPRRLYGGSVCSAALWHLLGGSAVVPRQLNGVSAAASRWFRGTLVVAPL